VRFVAATQCLAWPWPADWPGADESNEGNFAQFDNRPHVSRRESSRTKPAQYPSRTRRLKHGEASVMVRWIWFDLAPRCPLPSGRIEARSRFACRHDSDG
jgi:hypothetical protein